MAVSTPTAVYVSNMKPGFYGFEHSYLSRGGCKVNRVQVRGKSGPLHLSTVASYMSNSRKVGSVIAVNLPTDRGELYGELNRHSATVTRKNGRIAETFIISFDVRMTPEHQDEALGRFLMAVTFQGKTRAEGWRHVDHDHNPHAHVLLVDVDENGEPVAHFSRSGSFRREHSPVKGNPTVWLRQVWQDECNAVLEQHGYEFRIDRRSNLERGIEPQEASQRVEEAPAALPPETTPPPAEAAPECPPMHVDAPPADDTVDDLSEDEEDMAPVERLPPSQAVFVASEFMDELRDLRRLRATLEGHTKALETATGQLETAARESTEAFLAKSTAEKQMATATERLSQFQTEHGLAGRAFSVGIGKWKLEWKSALRKQGEQAQANFDRISREMDRAQHAVTSADNQVSRWENTKAERQGQVSTTQNQIDDLLASYGERATLESAEGTLNHTAHLYLADVDVEDLIDLYESGQISTAQYRDALELKGADQELSALQAKQAEDLDERLDEGLHR